MIKRKMLLSHFAISVIVMIILSNFEFDQIGYWIIYIFSLFLYVISGYIYTSSKSNWYNYFIVAIIGICLWTICFVKSPNDLNYKSRDGEYWFLYQLYIMVSSPLNVIDSINEVLTGNIKLQLYSQSLIPIIISICQYIGSILKLNVLNKNNNR